MRFWWISGLFILGCTSRGLAQTVDTVSPYTAAYADSLVTDDSVIKDLNAFIDSLSRPKTLLAVELGTGNGFFTTKSATAATGYVTKTFFTPSVTYLHKSGLGISGSVYATTDQGRMTVYQGAISPSYEIARRSWEAGISYTRYFNKDSLSFGVNPLRNDLYLYGVLKKFWLEPGLAFDWSFDAFRYDVQTVAGYITDASSVTRVHAHTLAGVFTLQHDFEWFGVVTKDDHLGFTPTVMTLADAANYDISIPNRLKTGNTTGGRGQKDQYIGRPNMYHEETSGTPPPLPTSFKESIPWAFESTGVLLNGVYTYKHFLVSSQVLATYFINASPGVSSYRISYLLSVGLVY